MSIEQNFFNDTNFVRKVTDFGEMIRMRMTELVINDMKQFIREAGLDTTENVVPWQFAICFSLISLSVRIALTAGFSKEFLLEATSTTYDQIEQTKTQHKGTDTVH